MESPQVRILLVEDDEVDRLAFVRLVKSTHLPYDYTCAGSASEAVRFLDAARFDVVVSDYMLGDGTAFDVLARVPEDVAFIIVTGAGDTELAVQAMKAGAADYLLKDTHGDYLKALPMTVANAIKATMAEKALRHAREELERRVEERTTPLKRINEQLLREIAERNKAEAALRESEERYRSLVENIDIGVTLVSTSYDVIMTNSARARQLGKDSGQLVGRKCYLAIAGRDAPCELCPGIKAIRTGLPTEKEIQGSRNDGSPYWMRVQAFPVFGSNGTAAGFINLVEDVTDRKRMEEHLRQTAKMEAIGMLAGGVAHDFNNVLTAVVGYCDILMGQLPRDQPYGEQVSQIARAAQRGTALTRQLLAFSRKQVLEMQALDLNQAICDFEKMIRRLIGVDVHVETVLERELEAVRADPVQVEQILMNLCVNARDAMPHGGTITIRTYNVMLDEDDLKGDTDLRPGPYIALTVTDDGIGMDELTRSRVFDPFFTTKGKGKGTGLGLSMVYGIVKQHQGRIMVHSEPGHGTSFSVFLPKADSLAQTQPETLRVPENATGQGTVLLVEDEEMVRNLAAEILRVLGYSVLVASDPEQALQVSERHTGHVDLLVTDVILPQMDGKKLFAKLSEFRPGLKVLYISGYAQDTVDIDGVDFAGSHFLQKPFTVQSLGTRVREAIEGEP